MNYNNPNLLNKCELLNKKSIILTYMSRFNFSTNYTLIPNSNYYIHEKKFI